MAGWLKRHFKKDQLILLAVGLCATALMAVLFVLQPRFFRFLDYKLYDLYMDRYHSEKTTPIPAIVDIDEKSLAEAGQWPWPRYRVAMLLKYIQAYGATSIASDIIFVEPDRTSPSILQKELKEAFKLDITINGLPPSLQDNDALLAKNLKTGPFVLGFDFMTREAREKLGDARASSECPIPPAKVAVLSPPGSPSPHAALPRAEGIVCPLPELARSARRSGFITISPDLDGVYRRVPLLYSWNDKFYPSLALAALSQAVGQKTITLKMSSIGVDSLRIGKVATVPLDKHGRMLINFRGPQKTFPYYSASDVLNKRIPKDALKNRIVFIGTSAAGLKDIRPTPLDPGYPGVEAHATIVDNLLSREFINIPDWAQGLEFFALLLICIMTTFLLMWARAAWIALPLLGLSIVMWQGSVHLYTTQHIYASPLYPFMGLGLTFTLLTALKFWREEQAKRFIHGAFAHYLAPSVIDRIMDDPDSLSLEGQEKEITIQFSDIRSFTSLSEKLSPTQVTNLLHDYLTPMTRIITEHHGTLDKFIGDAVMAFWNAPLDVPNHQLQAMKAAKEQLARLHELNELFVEKYGSGIAIGIGVHSGAVRVGNMGSADLFDYTLIGDNVNLASRLEGLTKFYGQTLVVSGKIVEACGDAYVFRELDSVRVKGKQEPVTIYTAYTHEEAAERKEELDTYFEGLALYKATRFSDACSLFSRLQESGREPILYSMYVDRCAHLQEEPPEPGWDGVFTHKTK
ncbi:CHASE2 domain-containing protein [Pseudodesulfovibrio tunisiensis]|uniref:CHASE2 domain-containing protein n=1 Tax=Pseudodesulfovibrio tunisiensis TaxID=463192 RepID=UPI001FB43BAE|nr:adenylate/guanylate cyclase domain-containing protein [Pseudodesulfovibrio tunisiensis]